MKIFYKWLKKYPKIKEKEDTKYNWLSLNTILKYEKIAEIYNVSNVARGLKQGTKTDKGFLKMLKEELKINSALLKQNIQAKTLQSSSNSNS